MVETETGTKDAESGSHPTEEKRAKPKRKTLFSQLHLSSKIFSLLMMVLTVLVMAPGIVFPLPKDMVVSPDKTEMGQIVLARHGWPYIYMDSIHVLDADPTRREARDWGLGPMSQENRFKVAEKSLYRVRYDSYLVSNPFSGHVNLPNPTFPVAPWMTSNGWNFRGHAREFRRQGLAVNVMIGLGFMLVTTTLFEVWRRMHPTFLSFKAVDAVLLVVAVLGIGGWWYTSTKGKPTAEQWNSPGTARCEAPDFLQRLTGSAPYRDFYIYSELPTRQQSGGNVGFQ